MELDEQGWIDDVRRVDSPNFDPRPDPDDISLLVIHGISLPPGEYGGPWIDQLFTNTLNPEDHSYFSEIIHLRVSSHLLLRRDGELVQYVSLYQRAWHAGISSFDGREACNDYSIGVELEGTDDESYTEIQYQELQRLSQSLMSWFPRLEAQRIAGHSDIAPGRKTDPGPYFDWDRFRAGLMV